MLVLKKSKYQFCPLAGVLRTSKNQDKEPTPKLLVLCRFFHDNHQFFEKISRTQNWKFSEAFQTNWNKPNSRLIAKPKNHTTLVLIIRR
jgi:hypothetical protein